MSNVTKKAQEQLLHYARQLAAMIIRNNWAYLSDAKGGPVSIENWTLTFSNRDDDEKETFKYTSPRKDGWPVKDFILKFDLADKTWSNVDLQGSASLGEATAIMKGILEFIQSQTKKEVKVADKSFEQEVQETRDEERKKITNIVADMSLQELSDWLVGHWGATSENPEGKPDFKLAGRHGISVFHKEYIDHACGTILEAIASFNNRLMQEEPTESRQELLLSRVQGMTDKELAIWFRNMRYNVGPGYLVFSRIDGSPINFTTPYFETFGREVASRLEAKRVDEDMLIVEIGKARPVNPMQMLKRFTAALDTLIQDGPEEPELRAYGSERQIAQPWIDWFRKTHACGFDVAWTEGAHRLVSKEYENRQEEFKKITWYPNNFNPLKIEIGKKLEFIQQ